MLLPHKRSSYLEAQKQTNIHRSKETEFRLGSQSSGSWAGRASKMACPGGWKSTQAIHGSVHSVHVASPSAWVIHIWQLGMEPVGRVNASSIHQQNCGNRDPSEWKDASHTEKSWHSVGQDHIHLWNSLGKQPFWGSPHPAAVVRSPHLLGHHSTSQQRNWLDGSEEIPSSELVDSR